MMPSAQITLDISRIDDSILYMRRKKKMNRKSVRTG